jgi:hypothetical protein
MGIDILGSQQYFHYTDDGKPSRYTLYAEDDNCYEWVHGENYPRRQSILRPDTASGRNDMFLRESFYYHDDPYDDIPPQLRHWVIRAQMWVENDRLYRKALDVVFSNFDFQLDDSYFLYGDVGLPRSGLSPTDFEVCP